MNPINDAPVVLNDAGDTEEEQPIVITVLDNDIDADETSNLEPNTIDPNTLVIEAQPAFGVVTVVDEITAVEDEELQLGQVIYTPDVNFFGIDIFSYTVKDTLGLISNSATVTVSVGNVDDAPIANNDSVTTNEDESVVIDVLSNDTDNDGEIDPSSVTIEQQGSLGTATVDDDTGNVIYTPSDNKFGIDSVLYTVKDEQGVQSNLGTITIEILPINDAPQTFDDTFTIDERTPTRLDVVGNDIDPDSAEQPENKIDVETVDILSMPTFGALQFEAETGTLIYTPNEDVTDETDIFTYQVADTLGAISNTATVSITLKLQSISLNAGDDNAETSEDSAVVIDVLGNDGDPTRELNVASINITSPANNGVAQVQANGTVLYVPNANFFGEDSFNYTVQDTAGNTSNAALVTINVLSVNDAPVISGSPETSVIADNNYQFKPSASDIDSNVLTFSIANKPSWSVFNASTGELSGIPADTDAGLYESIVITVNDEDGLSARLSPFTIEVESTTSLTPTAFDVSVQAVEDEPLLITTQATDPRNLPLVYEIVKQPEAGTLSGRLPNVTYTPSENYFGPDSFEFTASNGEYSSTPATVSINVSSVNDAPVAVDDEASVLQGQSITINPLVNDYDVEDEELSIVQATVAQGSIVVSNDQLVYTAPSNYLGIAIIDYTIADGEGLTGAAQILVTVTDNGTSEISLDVPADITVNATGIVTRVDLGQAKASDSFGNVIPVTLQTPPFFRPGKHTVVWQAQKGADEQQGAQLVTVNPMVTIQPSQQAAEGEVATINVYLNGEAASYPVSIPYTVSGTSDNDDHNLTDGTLIIESGTSAALNVEVNGDEFVEGKETLIVTIQPTFNVINAQHILTIVENSVEPELNLTAIQNDTRVTTIYPQLGTVEVKLLVENKGLGDIEYIDWSASSDVLNTLNESTSDTERSFAPNSLEPGLYHVRVKVGDKSGLSSSAEIALVLEPTPPELTDDDTDGDGIPDNQEGYGDSDGDGIANYLDSSDICNVQPLSNDSLPSYLLEGEFGACFRIGDTAALNKSAGPVINDNTIPPDDEFNGVGQTVDFIVSGLPVNGSAYRVVIPQQNVIPSNAIYRKYSSMLNRWEDFVNAGEDDTIHSAKGEQGVCPSPSAANWTEGLNVGDWCVRLTISDGGPNDEDGEVNGRIVDPSRLAIVISDNTPPVANEDSLSVNTGDSGILNVLDNDTDADGDSLILVSASAYVGAVIIENNTLVYMAPEDFSGTDTVLYSISDGNSGVSSTTAVVQANVNNVPVAQNDTAETDNETAITIDVLANDSDADGDVLTITTAESDKGAVQVVDNKLVFTPQPNDLGLATVNYRIEDSKGSVDEAIVFVTIIARANQPPLAQNDTVTTEVNTPVTVNVLANDSDPDGDALNIVSATAITGSVSILDASLTFIPSPDFDGVAIVDYVISDGVDEASATLTVRVIKSTGKSSGGSISSFVILFLFMALICRMYGRRGYKRYAPEC